MVEPRARLHAIFEQSPLGIACVALDGHWLLFNERFRQMIGYTRAQLGRITFHDLTHPDDAKLEAGLLRRLLSGDAPSYHIEKRVYEKRGRYREVDVVGALARDEQGNADCVVYFVSEKPERAAAAAAVAARAPQHDCGAVER